MHISRTDLNLFKVLDAIEAEGGITAASRRLHLSQPAVSHALSRLRELWNDPLFERHGQKMVATPLTRGIIGPVRASLHGLDQALGAGARFDPASSTRHFAVAMHDSLESSLLPALMTSICARAPTVRISAVRIERRSLLDDLSVGSVDAALDVPLALAPGLCRKSVFSEPLVVVARRGHPSIRGRLSLQGYLAQEHVQVSGRRSGMSVEDFELAKVGLARRVRLRCQQYRVACQVVARTDMLATMAQRYAAVGNQSLRNQVFAFPTKLPRIDTFLYWHENTEQDPASRWFRKSIEAALAGVSGGPG